MTTSTARTPRLLSAAALASAVVLLVASCGEDTGTGAAETETATTTQATEEGTNHLTDARDLDENEAAMANPGGMAEADTAPKTAEEAATEDAQLVVTDIRVGEHSGKDRVVFELSGEGSPGYEVSYVDAPAQQGSGYAVEVPGDAFLQVMISGMTLPTTTDADEMPVGEVSVDQGRTVAGVSFGGQFEGRAQSVIGVNGGEKPFSVFVVENPTRVVVDIDR